MAVALVSSAMRAEAGSGPLFPAQYWPADTDGPNASVAVGDLNGDGKLDVVTTNGSPAHSVSVLLGNGDGTMRGGITYSDYSPGYGPHLVAIADLNGDGKLDLIVAQDVGAVSIRLGNGDGTFAASTAILAGADAYGLAAADLNGDGKVDLAFTYNATGLSDPMGSVAVLLGNGDGTFGVKVNYPAGAFCESIVAADLNSDGKLDLVAADGNTVWNGPGTVAVLLGNGDGTFGATQELSTGNPTATQSVSVADFNGDGHPDIVVGLEARTSFCVGLGDGQGEFAFQYHPGSASTDDPTVVTGDFDGNGTADIAMTNPQANKVSVWLGAGDGSFGPQGSYDAGRTPLFVTSADLNGDGRRDLVVGHGNYDGAIVALIANSDGTFGSGLAVRADFSLDQSLALRDLNADGALDMVAPTSDGFAVALGHGNGTFSPWTDNPIGRSVGIVVVTDDLNGDHKPDLVLAMYGSNTVSVLLGHGDGTFGTKTDYVMASNCKDVATGDLNGDGKPDLVVLGHNVHDFISVFLGNSDGTFGTRTDIAVGDGAYPSIALGDLNGDGKLDLVAPSGAGVGVYLGDGNGGFGSSTVFPTGPLPTSVAIGDLNHDGRPDLVVANNDSNTVSVLVGHGDGTFAPRTDLLVRNAPSVVAIADFDGDGQPDVAVLRGETGGSISILPGRGDATFGPRTDYGVLTGLDLAVGDINQDGHPDLATSTLSKAVMILLNTGAQAPAGVGGSPAAGGLLSVRVWPNPLSTEALIAFSLPARGDVSLRVLDVTGRLVRTVARGPLAAGEQELRWNLSSDRGTKVAPGVYLVELRSGSARGSTRIAVTR